MQMWSGRRAWQGRNPEQLRGLIASGDERLEPPASAPSVLHVRAWLWRQVVGGVGVGWGGVGGCGATLERLQS